MYLKIITVKRGRIDPASVFVCLFVLFVFVLFFFKPVATPDLDFILQWNSISNTVTSQKHHGVSHHRQLDCVFNILQFKLTAQRVSVLLALCKGKAIGQCIPSQRSTMWKTCPYYFSWNSIASYTLNVFDNAAWQNYATNDTVLIHCGLVTPLVAFTNVG